MVANNETPPARRALSAAQRALLDQRLQRARQAAAENGDALAPIPRRNPADPVPLSFAQERLWFLDQLEPGTAVYNLCQGVRMKGALDVAAVERALQEIVRRHEVLRTNFVASEGNPLQVIVPERLLPLARLDLGDGPEAAVEADLQAKLEEESRRPFNLATDLLLRALLIRRSPTDHALVLTMHHIISDGWSVGVLLHELSTLYTSYHGGQTSTLPELPVQFADFVVWERANLQGPGLEQSLAFWKKQLGGPLPVLDLPFDHSPTATPTSVGGVHAVTFSRPLMDGLKHLSLQNGSTLFMTLLAAFQVLLHRWTGQDDILVGSIVAGRRRLELEKLVGFFVSTLVFRGDLKGSPSFRALLARTKDATLDAFAHQELPFEHLVKELRPDRTHSRNPLFQVMFLLQNMPASSADLPGMSLTPIELDTGTAKFDLTLAMMETPEGLRTGLEYNASLFEPATIARLLGSFETLLQGIVAHPDQSIGSLPLLSAAEQRQILVEWNDTALEYPRDACIHHEFAEQVRRTPNACAVVGGNERLTYAELDRRAEVIATRLRELGVGPDTLVGLFLRRTPQLLAGMLGVLKAGGAYVPLDPAYPPERLTLVADDAQLTVLVTERVLFDSRPARPMEIVLADADEAPRSEMSAVVPAATVSTKATDLAYVIYTSGSTGRPKGVAVTHRGVVALAAWAKQNYRPAELAGVLFSTSACFDVSLFESLVPLMLGGKIIVAENILEAGSIPASGEVILISGVPSAMAEVVRAKLMPPSVRTVNVAGEPCPQSLVESLYALDHVERVHDVYGPTETTVYSTGSVRTPGGIATIGRPLPNEQAYILDRNFQPVPIGVRGELMIGGDKLARGYLNQPALTAEKFIVVPLLPGRRLYRTGDGARFRSDGTIEFLGRLDRQVKIRGHRVEPGEAEAVMAAHPAVRECVVAVRDDALGGKCLVAYIVTNGTAPDNSAWRGYLSTRLPEFLVPSAFVLLDALPLAPNGKLDVNALPAVGSTRAPDDGAYLAPRDEVERKLVEIWEAALGTSPIGVRHHFFELGGHSLLAVRLVAKIAQHFDRKLPVAAIFQHRTIEQLARLLKGGAPAYVSTTSIVEIQGHGRRPPVYFVHGVGGGMFWGYANLARHLGAEQPVYAFKSRGLEGKPEEPTIEAMAASYVVDLRMQQPRGPYLLGGYCFGGVVAFEMARQLRSQGETVPVLSLINCSPPNSSYGSPASRQGIGWKLRFAGNLARWAAGFCFSWSMQQRVEFVRWKFRLLRKRAAASVGLEADLAVTDVDEMANVATYSEEQRRLWQTHVRALKVYHPGPYPGRMELLRTRGHPLVCSFDRNYGWGDFISGEIAVHFVPGGHGSVLDEPNVRVVAKAIAERVSHTTKH